MFLCLPRRGVIPELWPFREDPDVAFKAVFPARRKSIYARPETPLAVNVASYSASKKT